MTKKLRKLASLPTDYALVLQQVLIDGKDEINMLTESLNLSRRRAGHIITALKKKKLIKIERDQDNEIWVALSRKGANLVDSIWPESRLAVAF